MVTTVIFGKGLVFMYAYTYLWRTKQVYLDFCKYLSGDELNKS